MKVLTRLSSGARRAAIIKAVQRVFAEKGFDGTTTRELADAAEVSEALLFKHFPTKEALYAAMQQSCVNEQDQWRVERLKALEPSASTLALLVHFLVTRVIVGCSDSASEEAVLRHRLVLRSLAEDGEFARLLFQRIGSAWVPKVEQCLKAAIAAGDAVPGPVRLSLRGWFTQHLAAMIMFNQLPRSPVVDYGLPRDKLVEQVVWFALRGMGLTDAAIQRTYNARALALFDR